MSTPVAAGSSCTIIGSSPRSATSAKKPGSASAERSSGGGATMIALAPPVMAWRARAMLV
jgi:hypothetical protein